MAKVKYIRINRTDFISDLCAGISKNQFEKMFGHLLGSTSVDEAYKTLGGKVTQKKKEVNKEEETDK